MFVRLTMVLNWNSRDRAGHVKLYRLGLRHVWIVRLRWVHA
jgi:hypothetical protein